MSSVDAIYILPAVADVAVEVTVIEHLYQPLPTEVIVAVVPVLNNSTVPVDKLKYAPLFVVNAL